MREIPRVSIIVLNLNGYQDTRDCLESLRQVHYRNFEVVLVDNGSSDNSGERLCREFPEIHLIRSEQNVGFTGGNNLGIAQALNNGADYVLLLNNDTFVDPDFLTQLVQVGESDQQIGILGPKIFYASDPDRVWFAGGYINYRSGRCAHVGHDETQRDDNVAESTAWITGCALLIKSHVLKTVGFLDNRLFVYWEDADLCMRVRESGLKCVLVPSARVWHKVSRTCGLGSVFTLYLGTRNQLLWVARHIPFPYKLTALAVTLMKKFFKAILLLFRNPDSACAVLAGILDFVLGKYGPPAKSRVPS